MTRDEDPAAVAILALRNLGGLAFHGRRIRGLHFEPIGRTAGAVRRSLMVRDNAFEAQLAGMDKDGGAVAFNMLVESDARTALLEPLMAVTASQQTRRSRTGISRVSRRNSVVEKEDYRQSTSHCARPRRRC